MKRLAATRCSPPQRQPPVRAATRAANVRAGRRPDLARVVESVGASDRVALMEPRRHDSEEPSDARHLVASASLPFTAPVHELGYSWKKDRFDPVANIESALTSTKSRVPVRGVCSRCGKQDVIYKGADADDCPRNVYQEGDPNVLVQVAASPRFWWESHRADRRSVATADRHYNRQRSVVPSLCPPGRCVVLRRRRGAVGDFLAFR